MCHEDDELDREGLAAWLASSMRLAGIILLREPAVRRLTKIRRELRRVGFWRLFDVLAFRIYYRAKFARGDAQWIAREIDRLRKHYRGSPHSADILITSNPNSNEVGRFLERVHPDLMLIRSKYLLKQRIFMIPEFGTYVLHPGICPEYRNAHGCFWALANRDLEHVGMTLLRVDSGVDTGPILLQASYPYDEVNETHRVIQYRVILENLERITRCLIESVRRGIHPLNIEARTSNTWGQPWLSAYLKWKRAARKTARLCA